MKWDGTIGPASVISLLGALGVFATVAIAWGTITTKVDMMLGQTSEVKTSISEVSKVSAGRDRQIAAQGERLGKVETSVQFMVPALQRIEQKLDTPKQ